MESENRMSLALALPINGSISQETFPDSAWLRFFDIRAAVNAVSDHVDSLASVNDTPYLLRL